MKKLLCGVVAGWLMVSGLGQQADAASRRHVEPVIDIMVNIGDQEMVVDVNGFTYATWRVSTAREGYYTPRGSYSVKRMAREYYSVKYDNAPMPNSVFFKGGYAIHATNFVRALGRPASHGCVRLHPQNAARLFSLVQKYGMTRTRITLVD
jgi:lipoprotein-anchoring transpeptidase ErfK/SrfK